MNGRITFTIGTLRRTNGSVRTIHVDVPCGDIESRNGSFKDFKGYERLIEGYFVARFIDAHKTEGAALLDLAVDDAIACGDVNVACFVKAGLVDFE